MKVSTDLSISVFLGWEQLKCFHWPTTLSHMLLWICAAAPVSLLSLTPLYGEAFTLRIAQGESTVVLTHSGFLHDALLISTVSPLLEVSLSALLLYITLHQPVCQPASLTKPSAFLYWVKSGKKLRPTIFLYRMTIYCIGDIQPQTYKI